MNKKRKNDVEEDDEEISLNLGILSLSNKKDVYDISIENKKMKMEIAELKNKVNKLDNIVQSLMDMFDISFEDMSAHKKQKMVAPYKFEYIS